MKIHIKTKEVEFNFDDDKVFTMYHHIDRENKPILTFLKELIQEVADKSLQIKQGNAN